MSTPLVVRFQAETAQAKGAVMELARITAGAMGSVSASALAAHQASGFSLGGIAMSAAKAVAGLTALQYAAIAAFAGFTAAAAAGAAELERFEAIAKKSLDANVGSTFFQSFSVGAARLGVDLREAEADIKRLERATREQYDYENNSVKRSQASEMLGERFLGTNEFGLSRAPQLFEQARNAEERIRAIQVALVDMEVAGQRLAAIDLARKLGLTGVAEQVDRGRTSFAAWAAETERLGATGIRDGSIVSPELISRAEELRKRFEDNTRELTQNLRPILDICAGLALSIGNGAAWSAEQFTALVGVVGRVVQALRDAAVQANALQGAAARALANQTGGGFGAAPALDDAAGQAAAARDAAARRFRQGTLGQAARERGDNFNPEDPTLRAIFGAEPPPATTFGAPVPNGRPRNAPRPETPSSSNSPAEQTDDWAKAYKRLIEQMERANGLSQAELAGINQGTVARERLTAVARLEAEARKAGGEVTEAERQRVIALAEEHGRLKVAIEEAGRAQRAFGDALQYAGDRFVDMAFNGRKLSDVLRGVAAELARAAITGQGMFAQLLGLAPKAGSPPGTVGGLLGLFQGGLGGGGADGVNAGLGSLDFWTNGFTFHQGGVIGGPAPARAVPVSIFDGAPRYHRGGAIGPGEVPVIAQLGEEMLTRQQRLRTAQALRAGAGEAGQPVAMYNDFRGADPMSVAAIQQRLDRMERSFGANSRAAVDDMARHGARPFGS